MLSCNEDSLGNQKRKSTLVMNIEYNDNWTCISVRRSHGGDDEKNFLGGPGFHISNNVNIFSARDTFGEEQKRNSQINDCVNRVAGPPFKRRVTGVTASG